MDLNSNWDKVKEGDEKAFEGFVKEMSPFLLRYILFITGDPRITDEILQDVFLKLWTGREKIMIRGTIKSYLYKTAKNHSINYLLGQKTKKSSVHNLVSGESWQFISETLEFNDEIIEKLEAKDTLTRVEDCVKELPDQCRAIFEQSRFRGKSNKEIAVHFKISENTVRAQLWRALVKLRSALFHPPRP